MIPKTHWLSSYSKEKLKGDLSAGITTGLMFIPQSMAYAMIAGMPPIYGLYAGIIPLLIFPFISSAKELSMGPVALDMLIIGAGLVALAAPESPEYISLVILLTLMTGAFQLFMGFLGLGSILNFFSRPVIAGFTFAAPIIIIGSQLPSLFGVELPQTQDIYQVISELYYHINETHYITIIAGTSVIALLYLFKRLFPLFPSSALILALSIAASFYFQAESHGVKIVGDIPRGLPGFSMPAIGASGFRDLLTTAIVLTLIQFMTVASLGRTFAKRNKYIFNTNRELTALGLANFLGSFFKSIPISGSMSRSAVAEQSNAQSPLNNWVTAMVVVMALLFMTPVFYYMPLAVLAAIIIASIIHLINLKEFVELFKTTKAEGFIAVFTAIATLVIGIQEGIFLGVVASLLKTLYQYTRPNVAELGLVPGTHLFMDLDRDKNAKRIKRVLILRVDASFSYINADFFRDIILQKSKNRSKTTEYVIIDGSTINTLDSTAIEQLEIMTTTLRNWGMDLYITGLKGHIRDIIRKSGYLDYLGKDHLFREPNEAVQYLLRIMDKKRLETYKRYVEEGDLEKKTKDEEKKDPQDEMNSASK